MYTLILDLSTSNGTIQLDKLSLLQGHDQVWVGPRTSEHFSQRREVNAVCLVLIAALDELKITGETGSCLSQLDYALEQRDPWLRNLLGPLPNFPYILFERSRSGSSVTFSVNRRWCKETQLIVDGVLYEKSEELQSLQREALRLWGDQCTLVETPPIRLEVIPEENHLIRSTGESVVETNLPFFSHHYWSQRFRDEFEVEAMYSLSNPAIHSKESRDLLLKQVEDDDGYRHISGTGREGLVSEIDDALSSAYLIGELEQKHLDTTLAAPLRIAIGPGGIGTILVLKYMKDRLGYNIEYTYRFPHSQHIISVLQHEELAPIADGIILDTSSAGRFLSRGRRPKYRPLMLMPGTTNRLLRSGGAHPRHTFSQMNDDPSSAWLYLRRMDPKVKIEAIREDKVITAFSEKDSDRQGILWWPYCMFQEVLGLAQRDESLNHIWAYDLTSLFVHESLFSNNTALWLNLGIRQAWRAVLLDSDFRASAIDELLRDPGYTGSLYLFNGLSALKEADYELRTSPSGQNAQL